MRSPRTSRISHRASILVVPMLLASVASTRLARAQMAEAHADDTPAPSPPKQPAQTRTRRTRPAPTTPPVEAQPAPTATPPAPPPPPPPPVVVAPPPAPTLPATPATPPTAQPPQSQPVLTPVVTSDPSSVSRGPVPGEATSGTEANPAALPTVGPTAQDYANHVLGNQVRQNTNFSEDRTPPGMTGAGASSNDMQFALHGYFRAPFRMAWNRRSVDTPGQSKYNLHTPYLVDDDYFQSGFRYTPVNETDYTELFLSVGNQHVTGTVAIFGSLYSDSAQPLINNQMGISQGYVTLRYEPEILGKKTRVQVKGGAFWDRFGWIEKYDTYLFGRTHQEGAQVRIDADLGKFTFTALDGVGAHLENISANQGLSLLHYLHLNVAYDKTIESGFYYLRTWTDDERQLLPITDANMRIMGFDVRANMGAGGRIYVAGSILNAREALYLAPSIEVMNSNGGEGITQNYLGTTSSDNGSGNLDNLGLQYDFSLLNLLKANGNEAASILGPGDVKLSLFGIYSYVTSRQQSTDPTVNENGIKYFKWGSELTWWGQSWLGIGARYDHVSTNLDDNASTFRTFSPRITFRSNWIGEDSVYFQYSRYFYGDRVELRSGQVANESTPNDNVVKIQAQAVF